MILKDDLLVPHQFCVDTDGRFVGPTNSPSVSIQIWGSDLSDYYTLWPFWVDTHVDPPFTKKSDGKVYDSHSRHVKYYPDVPAILHSLKSERYRLGIASRTPCSDEACDLVQLFEWDKYFDYKQIYPGSKTNHFSVLKNQSNLPYQEMLFFDDEHRNIEDVGRLGVTCIRVDDGLTEACLKRGLETFAKNHS